MKVLNKGQIFFYIFLCIFFTNQIVDYLGFSLPIIQSYLDDLLCFPVVLYIVLIVHRRWRLKNENYTLPILHIVISISFFILIFEIIFPLISVRYTADLLDILAYGIGSTFFYLFMNK